MNKTGSREVSCIVFHRQLRLSALFQEENPCIFFSFYVFEISLTCQDFQRRESVLEGSALENVNLVI